MVSLFAAMAVQAADQPKYPYSAHVEQYVRKGLELRMFDVNAVNCDNKATGRLDCLALIKNKTLKVKLSCTDESCMVVSSDHYKE